MEKPIEWTNLSQTETTYLDRGHIPADKLLEVIRKYPNSTPGFHAMYDMAYQKDFTQYTGVSRPALGCLVFDFDEKHAANTTNDVINFCNSIKVPYQIFFSGRKGFHVYVHQSSFSFQPTPANMGLLSKQLRKSYFPTIDTVIYQANRRLRMPGSMHQETGLYKIPVTLEELSNIDSIKLKAKHKPDMSAWSPLSTPNEVSEFLSSLLKEESKSEPKDRGQAVNKNQWDEYYRPFISFDKKLCIKKILDKNTRIDMGERHNLSLILASEFYFTKYTQENATKTLYEWSEKVGLVAEGRWGETQKHLDGFYSGEYRYAFGCNGSLKSNYCSGSCKLRRMMPQEKRPFVVDAPASELKEYKKEVPEHELVKDILNLVGSKILKCNKILFKYIEEYGYWKMLTQSDEDKIKRGIYELLGDSATYWKVDACYRTFVSFIDSTPENVDLFHSVPFYANFKNGALFFNQKTKEVSFIPAHERKPEMYLVNVLPYDWNPESSSVNQVFEDILKNLFSEQDKKDACQEMLGACLFPVYPRLFYLYGQPLSGKSTLLLLARKMMSPENVSNMDPSQFTPDFTTLMMGKLVNIVTDISNRPITDHIIKQIVDRVPIPTKIKYKDNLMIRIPSVHCFGSNHLLNTVEGSNKGHERRWTFIAFEKTFTTEVDDFANKVFNAGPQHIFEWALEGFKRVVANGGKYTQPRTGVLGLEESVNLKDIVQAWIDDIRAGGESIEIKEGEKCRSKQLKEHFMLWQQKLPNTVRKLGIGDFYIGLKEKGFKKQHYDDGDYFHGFSLTHMC